MPKIADITSIKYTAGDAEKSIASLSQGEVDVLNQIREALGWPSIKSLAVKYYPAFPNRKWWLAALRKTQRLARRTNIIYLLKCLQSIQEEWQAAAFSGKEALNRLTQKAKNILYSDVNRLEYTDWQNKEELMVEGPPIYACSLGEEV